MRKVFRSGVLALIGLAAPAAVALAPAAAQPAAAASAPIHAAATAGPAVPGLYHVPIIGKVTLPGVLGSVLGNGLRHATAVQSSNWAGYADTNDTFNAVSSSWTEPTVNCANSSGGLNGLLGLSSLSTLLGGPGAASAFWVGLDGYNSTSVEQLGTDSDCQSGSPSYYAWYEMYPNPSVQLPNQYPVRPGDTMTALVSANPAGTSFTLMIKDSTAGWSFSTTQTGSGFARSSAEVIAEAPSSCTPAVLQRAAAGRFRPGRLLGLVGAQCRRDQGIAVVLQRQRDHHVEQRDDAGHAEQPEPGRVVVLGGVERLVGRGLSRGRSTARAARRGRSPGGCPGPPGR